MKQTQNTALSWTFLVVLVMSLAVLGGGLFQVLSERNWALFATGCACVIGTLLAWAVVQSVLAAQRAAAERLQIDLQPFGDRLQQIAVMVNLISEQQLLSDRGKSIAYRSKDREALRFAIREEINHGDLEAAIQLANEMEASFGYQQEAEQFRNLINDRRQDNLRRHVAEGVAVVDRHIRSEQWKEAAREAEVVARRYPTSEQARNLPAEVEARRQQHKRQLTESFYDAVNRKDTDGAIELLKRLDEYISPAEAEALQESARSIFKAKLESLRSQFSAAVHEQKWADALRVGDAIVRDFPNTQMAKEVRDNLDTLRQRAGDLAAV